MATPTSDTLAVVDRVLRLAQRCILVLTSLVVVALICAAVFLRYVLGMGLYGIEEVVVFVGVWLFFFGASYASCRGEHITSDVIPQHLKSPLAREGLRFATRLITLALCLLLAYWAYDWLVWGLQTGPRSTVHEIPLSVTHSAVLASFLLMCLYALVDVINAGMTLARRMRRQQVE